MVIAPGSHTCLYPAPRYVRLDPFINQNPFDLTRQPDDVVESMGHYYSKFSPVPSLLALPLYAIIPGLPWSGHHQEACATSRFTIISLTDGSCDRHRGLLYAAHCGSSVVLHCCLLERMPSRHLHLGVGDQHAGLPEARVSSLALSILILVRSEERLQRLSWRAVSQLGVLSGDEHSIEAPGAARRQCSGCIRAIAG